MKERFAVGWQSAPLPIFKKIQKFEMKNLVLVFEFSLILVSLVLSGFWVSDPDGNYEPYIAVILGITAFLEFARRMVGNRRKIRSQRDLGKRYVDQSHQMHFIKGLPALRRAAHENARELWDGGVTAEMRQGSYDYIDSLQDIWVRLARFYPPNHFGGVEPREYINKYTQDRFSYHRASLEPEGPGTGGTIVGVMAGGGVIEDLEKMIEETVCTLSLNSEPFDYQSWQRDWKGNMQ